MYKRYLAGMMAIVLIGILLFSSNTAAQGIELERRGENLIRFHVLANSDSPEDQLLKLKVRDKVIEAMAEDLERSNSIAETRGILEENLAKIQEVAREEILLNGEDFKVKVELDEAVFPTRRYGNMVFPAGKYQALKVIIGEGAGENWWCVMFPPLCFVDVKNGLTDERTNQALKSNLSKEEYDLFYAATKQDELPLKLRFKVVELFEASRNQIGRLASVF